MASRDVSRRSAAWAHILNAALAAWLVAAPVAIGYGGALRTADEVLGPVGAACALVAAWGTTRGLRHVDVVIGAWFVIAPWVFAAGGAATANSMTVGIAMMVLALAGRRVHGRFDGGWAAVWRPVA